MKPFAPAPVAHRRIAALGSILAATLALSAAGCETVDSGPRAERSAPEPAGPATQPATLPALTETRVPQYTSGVLGRSFYALPESPERDKMEEALAEARAALSADPSDPSRIVWVGRRLGYLWEVHAAIEVYSGGIKKFPEYAPLYRHRGHRYITLRRFDEAIAAT